MNHSERRADLRDQLSVAALVAVGLAVLGALLGLIWDVWSPPSPQGIVSPPGIQINDIDEALVGADGRYVIMTAVVGILAAVGVWFLRGVRGPWVALGLAVGGLLGALLTELTGRELRGTGVWEYATSGQAFITRLPLSVQARGLWFIEAGLAVLVYSLLVAFASADDLGRPDPGRRVRAGAAGEPDPAAIASSTAASSIAASSTAGDSPDVGPSPYENPTAQGAPAPSVAREGEGQYGRGDGDGPGLA